jgi:hypothetical protein
MFVVNATLSLDVFIKEGIHEEIEHFNAVQKCMFSATFDDGLSDS